MPSVPTTSIDLSAADVVADPYPRFAEERSRHEVAWHEPSGTWLTFSHAAAGAVLRNRRLGLAGEPESRGTFVLRGFRRVMVGNGPTQGPRRPSGPGRVFGTDSSMGV